MSHENGEIVRRFLVVASVIELADALNVSRQSVYNWLKQ